MEEEVVVKNTEKVDCIKKRKKTGEIKGVCFVNENNSECIDSSDKDIIYDIIYHDNKNTLFRNKEKRVATSEEIRNIHNFAQNFHKGNFANKNKNIDIKTNPFQYKNVIEPIQESLLNKECKDLYLAMVSTGEDNKQYLDILHFGKQQPNIKVKITVEIDGEKQIWKYNLSDGKVYICNQNGEETGEIVDEENYRDWLIIPLPVIGIPLTKIDLSTKIEQPERDSMSKNEERGKNNGRGIVNVMEGLQKNRGSRVI